MCAGDVSTLDVVMMVRWTSIAVQYVEISTVIMIIT